MMSFAVVRFLGLKLREWCRLETKSKTRQAVVGRHRATLDLHGRTYHKESGFQEVASQATGI